MEPIFCIANRLESHEILDKSNYLHINFDTLIDKLIKYHYNWTGESVDNDNIEEPLSIYNLFLAICHHIDGYGDNLISVENKIKLRPHIEKVMYLFKAYQEERIHDDIQQIQSLTFICFRLIRIQCRSFNDDRKLFIPFINKDKLRDGTIISIFKDHSRCRSIVEEGLLAIGNIALASKEINLDYFIDDIITIISMYDDDKDIVQSGFSTLNIIVAYCYCDVDLKTNIKFFIYLIKKHYNNFKCLTSGLDLLKAITIYEIEEVARLEFVLNSANEKLFKRIQMQSKKELEEKIKELENKNIELQIKNAILQEKTKILDESNF